MSTLDKAIRIAAQIHEGQKDRYGEPYILHPIRVMQRVESEPEKIAAILHDVIEDSEWTLDDLRREGFSKAIVDIVDRLSRRENEPYFEYLERVKPNRSALNIKLADLEDNMDMRRISKLSKDDPERMARYHQAWLELKKLRTKS